MRKRLDSVEGARRQPDEAQGIHDLALFELTSHGSEDLKVPVGREVEIEVGLLHNSSHAREKSGTISVQIFSENFYGSGGGFQEREDHPYGRTLARSVGAEKTKDIGPVDFQIYSPDSPSFSELLAEVMGPQDNVFFPEVSQIIYPRILFKASFVLREPGLSPGG